jgi:hypothetical protein
VVQFFPEFMPCTVNIGSNFKPEERWSRVEWNPVSSPKTIPAFVVKVLSIAAQRNLPHRVVETSQPPPFPRHSEGVATFIDIAAEGARFEIDLAPLCCAHFGESR